MSRATRHTRTPAPPQTFSAPPGAAARPSTPPIRVVPSRESPRSTSRIPPFHLANRAAAMPARGVPPQGSNDVVETHLAAAALDTRRVPPRRGPRRWPDPRYRRPTPRPPPGQATSNRAPRRARMRSTTATTSCPGGAPRSPARRGARLPGGPVPSTLFVIQKFRVRRSNVNATVGQRRRPSSLSRPAGRAPRGLAVGCQPPGPGRCCDRPGAARPSILELNSHINSIKSNPYFYLNFMKFTPTRAACTKVIFFLNFFL